MKLYKQLLQWYSSKPLWMKILFFGVLIIVFLLYLVSMLSPIKPKQPTTVQSIQPPPFGVLTDKVDQELEKAKLEYLNKLGKIKQIGIRVEERRKAIRGASTMEELDELKRRYDL